MQDRMLFTRILGIERPWFVGSLELSEASEEVIVRLEHSSDVALSCPKCGVACPGYDTLEPRRWRHLDTCQYRTIVEAAVPRCRCPEHGVLQVSVPWAEQRSKFTLLFERLAIDWLRESSRSAVSRRMRLTWWEIHGIMRRAVRRGLARRDAEVVPLLGVDEKSFQGRKYVTMVCDLTNGHVLHVADDRSRESLDEFYEGLSAEQLAGIEGVAMDMHAPYVASTVEHVPDGSDKIVFDKFHVAQNLSKAVDAIRRSEHKALSSSGDERLKGTRYGWLRNSDNETAAQKETMADLRKSKLRTARGWALKDAFSDFWMYSYRKSAERFFAWWHGWAIRSRLEPMKKVARSLKAHLKNLLTYFKHPITNAMSESVNSKIQWIKYMSRGFRSREGFRNAIYFHCGGLDLYPH